MEKKSKGSEKSRHLGRRLVMYLAGLIIMTLGIGISVKSNLGVSPVSSIPYTMTCVWGIEMGRATIIFHVFLVIVQIILLRKAFRLKNLLQIPVGILFGYLTTASNYLMTFFPDPTSVWVQLILSLCSTFFVAFGIFLYVPPDIIPLAGEGAMLAISEKFKFKFSNVKLAFDISMVTISLITCLIAIHSLGSVGIGTIIAAVLVGTELKAITRAWGDKRDHILRLDEQNAPTAEEAADEAGAEKEKMLSPLRSIMKKDVYTISEDSTILEALEMITKKKVSGMPVVSEDGNPIGFISDGDIVRFLAKEDPLFVNVTSLIDIGFDEKARSLIALKVREIAAKKVITVRADDDLSRVCYVLSDHHIKKAPVMENGKMIGIINISNITKYIVQQIAH